MHIPHAVTDSASGPWLNELPSSDHTKELEW